MIKQICKLMLIGFSAGMAHATVITLSGAVSVSPQDALATPVANPGLINVVDGDVLSIALNFSGSVSSPGTLSLTSVSFTDTTASVVELAFVSGTVVVTPAGAASQFDVLGCLSTGSGCSYGNQLALEFQIPTGSLTGTGVKTQLIPSLLMLDLQEDDGLTEVQGTLSTYSYSGATGSPTPEPSTILMTAYGAACLFAARRRTSKTV